MGCIIDDAIEKLAGRYESVADKLLGLKYATKQGFNLNKAPTFSKLPVNDGKTKTMVYAGIGSRETPTEVQNVMSKAAKWLESKGYALRSGGANGADFAFEKGLDKNSKNKEVYLANTDYKKNDTFFNDRSNAGYANQNTDIVFEDRYPNNNRNYIESASKNIALDLVNEVHPNPKGLNGIPRNLMARNAFQVFGKELDSPVDFVLTWTPLNDKGEVVTSHSQRAYDKDKKAKLEDGVPTFDTGGTGQAISYASLKGIPVINMADPNWRKQLEDVMKNNKDKTMRTNTLDGGKLKNEETKTATKVVEDEAINTTVTDKNYGIVDVKNIFENGSGPDKFQAVYVATSRPSEKLFMVGDWGEVKAYTETEQKSTADSKPATYNTKVDTIAEEIRKCGV